MELTAALLYVRLVHRLDKPVEQIYSQFKGRILSQLLRVARVGDKVS